MDFLVALSIAVPLTVFVLCVLMLGRRLFDRRMIPEIATAGRDRWAARCEMLRPLLENGEQDLEAMEAMRRETAERLQAAHGERPAIIAAIERFLDFGDAGEYSPAELWDYFCISSPTIPALAGYDATE